MKFYVKKLGCPKNDVDADYIAGYLVSQGHEFVAEPTEAEAIIVNTCGFILPAKEESIDHILRACQIKTGREVKIFVTGCLAQRYSVQIADDMPEVDGVFGLGQLEAIGAAMSGSEQAPRRSVTESRQLSFRAGPVRHIADDLPYTYLKISDGCNRRCTYCVIPSIRGKFRSRSLDDLVNEASFLAGHGKRELILVSQDATAFGSDLAVKSDLVQLVAILDGLPDIDWIRVMYLHPANTDQQLIKYMTDPTNKVVSYFDLPLQHVDDTILKAMRRSYRRRKLEKLIDRIRQADSEATIRATFIVGFPGETEQQFEDLLEFLSKYQLDRVAAFTYSEEEGSPAAKLANQVPEELKLERLDRLMSLQRDIAFDRNDSLIGSRPEVMLDRLESPNKAVGRTRADCPEIDQEVFVSGKSLAAGQICHVQIDGVDGYDLFGTVCQE